MQTNKQIEIRSNKQIVDKFSKETGIKDPIVDTFIAMQDDMPDLGHYSILGSRRIDTMMGVDPGFYEGTLRGIWSEYVDKATNRKKYFEGDWKRVEKDGEQYLAKTIKEVINKPRGRMKLTGITPWES